MPFQIAQDITPHQQVPVPILHPATREPTGLILTLHGRYTAGWRAAQAAYRAQVAGQPVADDARLAEAMRPFLAHALADWTGVLDEQGQPVPCTPETARALFDAVEWLYEQLFEAFLDTARFFGTAKASSSPSPATSSPSAAS